MTHTKAQTCAEVAKLQITRRARSRGLVVPIAKPSISEKRGDELGTAFSTAGATHESYGENVVEAAGVEGSSMITRDALARASWSDRSARSELEAIGLTTRCSKACYSFDFSKIGAP